MTLKKVALTAVAVIILIAAVYLFVMFRQIYTPTTGERIGAYPQPAKALLVIDVQQDYTGPKSNSSYEDVEPRIRTINRLIEAAAQAGVHVVYIRQLFDNNLITRTFIGKTIEGLPGAEIDSRISIINGNDFTKKISDAFSNPRLDGFLKAHQVNELYLTGLDGVYCVHKTALGGINRGYKVAVITDAVMSRKKMAEVLKLYEKDRIPTTTSDRFSALR
jgi:nicotinamidase-related amidase